MVSKFNMSDYINKHIFFNMNRFKMTLTFYLFFCELLGACLARCSQPEVGWLGWRSTNDENLVKAIADACAFDRAAAAHAYGSNKYIFKSNSTKFPSESDSNISHPSSLSTLSNEKVGLRYLCYNACPDLLYSLMITTKITLNNVLLSFI